MLSQLKEITGTAVPKLAFLGLGWIGKNRMQSILNSGLAKACVIADLNKQSISEAQLLAEDALCLNDLNEILLTDDIDGVVIATPNSLHAEQSILCLEKGLAVFCQKPLGRTAGETKQIISTAQSKNSLLGVDLSYRYTDAFQKIYNIIKEEKLGKIFSVDLTFHNGYGPGKEWFYNTQLSGGGCVIDLGIHLIDLALLALGFPEIKNIQSKLYSNGKRISGNQTEDYASVIIEFKDDILLNLKCSWNLNIGEFASIEASFYGTKGGASLKNVNGSYYDFVAQHNNNVTKEIISTPPDDWTGRAALNWVKNLSAQNKFDNSILDIIKTAEVIDKIYGRGET